MVVSRSSDMEEGTSLREKSVQIVDELTIGTRRPAMSTKLASSASFPTVSITLDDARSAY